MDTSPPRSPLYRHLASAGPMSRLNPELLRIHRETGFSVEHLFKVATGRRAASLPLALAVARAVAGGAVPADSFRLGAR